MNIGNDLRYYGKATYGCHAIDVMLFHDMLITQDCFQTSIIPEAVKDHGWKATHTLEYTLVKGKIIDYRLTPVK